MPYNLLMGMDYTWFYVEANIVSIIIFTIMLSSEADDALYKEKAART